MPYEEDYFNLLSSLDSDAYGRHPWDNMLSEIPEDSYDSSALNYFPAHPLCTRSSWNDKDFYRGVDSFGGDPLDLFDWIGEDPTATPVPESKKKQEKKVVGTISNALDNGNTATTRPSSSPDGENGRDDHVSPFDLPTPPTTPNGEGDNSANLDANGLTLGSMGYPNEYAKVAKQGSKPNANYGSVTLTRANRNEATHQGDSGSCSTEGDDSITTKSSGEALGEQNKEDIEPKLKAKPKAKAKPKTKPEIHPWFANLRPSKSTKSKDMRFFQKRSNHSGNVGMPRGLAYRGRVFNTLATNGITGNRLPGFKFAATSQGLVLLGNYEIQTLTPLQLLNNMADKGIQEAENFIGKSDLVSFFTKDGLYLSGNASPYSAYLCLLEKKRRYITATCELLAANGLVHKLNSPLIKTEARMLLFAPTALGLRLEYQIKDVQASSLVEVVFEQVEAKHGKRVIDVFAFDL